MLHVVSLQVRAVESVKWAENLLHIVGHERMKP